MIQSTTPITYIREAFISKAYPVLVTIFQSNHTTTAQGQWDIQVHFDTHKSSPILFNTSYGLTNSVTNGFRYYFCHVPNRNIVNLNPKNSAIKLKIINRYILIISLWNYQMLVETSWFTLKNPIYIPLILEHKQDQVILKIMNLKTISRPPKFSKHFGNGFHIQHTFG